jgi:hypothetical protein
MTETDETHTEHEYGDYQPTGEIKASKKWYLWRGDGQRAGWERDPSEMILAEYVAVETVAIQQRYAKRCQKEGCTEVMDHWRDERVVPVEDLDRVGFAPSEFPHEYEPEFQDNAE